MGVEPMSSVVHLLMMVSIIRPMLLALVMIISYKSDDYQDVVTIQAK